MLNFGSEIFSKVNLNFIKLKIENELNLVKEKKIGNSEFIFNKFKRYANYQIDKNLNIIKPSRNDLDLLKPKKCEEYSH